MGLFVLYYILGKFKLKVNAGYQRRHDSTMSVEMTTTIVIYDDYYYYYYDYYCYCYLRRQESTMSVEITRTIVQTRKTTTGTSHASLKNTEVNTSEVYELTFLSALL